MWLESDVPARAFIITCVFMMACIFTANVKADPSVLKVCYEPWEPYVFQNEDGQVQGISVELLDAALAAQGLTADYRELPFKRCINNLHKNKFDIAIPISAGRAELHDTNTIFAYWTLSAIVPEHSQIDRPVTLDELSSARVILISGYGYPEKIARWAATHSDIARVTYSSDGEGLVPFNMLSFGRADVFIEDNYWSANLIERHELDLKVLEPALDSAVSVAGFRAGLEEVRDGVDEHLTSKGQTFRDRLFLKYTGFPESFFSGQYQKAASH